MLRFEIETEDADWWISVYKNDGELGRNWTETITSADLLPYKYRTLIVYDPNPPYPGASVNIDYSLSTSSGPGGFYKTA